MWVTYDAIYKAFPKLNKSTIKYLYKLFGVDYIADCECQEDLIEFLKSYIVEQSIEFNLCDKDEADIVRDMVRCGYIGDASVANFIC